MILCDDNFSKYYVIWICPLYLFSQRRISPIVMVKYFSSYRLQATFPTHNHKHILDLLSRHQRLLLQNLCLYLTAAHLITSTFLLNCPLNQLRSSNTSFASPPLLIDIDSFQTDLQSMRMTANEIRPHDQSSTIPRPSVGCLQFLSLTKSSGCK